MGILKLNKQQKRVEINKFELENDIVFNYFNKVADKERDETLFRAIYIGVLALMEDRISAFLSKTTNELGTELESLKMIFDMKKELFYLSTQKGTTAESDIEIVLNNYFKAKELEDKAILTGNTSGNIENNKTGDLICQVDGKEDLLITIECKFDKSIIEGSIKDKEVFKKKSDTAWSQLIEADANRGSEVSIIVFDLSVVNNSILGFTESVRYNPGVGFIVVIDSRKGDYRNLITAYMLAKDIVKSPKIKELDKDLLGIIITRIIKDITDINKIKKLVDANIKNNKDILQQLEKSLLTMDFNKEYLQKFLESGTLSKEDLLEYYMGEKVNEKYIAIEKEIKDTYDKD